MRVLRPSAWVGMESGNTLHHPKVCQSQRVERVTRVTSSPFYLVIPPATWKVDQKKGRKGPKCNLKRQKELAILQVFFNFMSGFPIIIQYQSWRGQTVDLKRGWDKYCAMLLVVGRIYSSRETGITDESIITVMSSGEGNISNKC